AIRSPRWTVTTGPTILPRVGAATRPWTGGPQCLITNTGCCASTGASGADTRRWFSRPTRRAGCTARVTRSPRPYGSCWTRWRAMEAAESGGAWVQSPGQGQGRAERAQMRSRARDLSGPLAGPANQPPRRGKHWRLRAQARAGALTALLVFAVGVVSAADVCKLAVCWTSAAAKHEYECSEGCYFENNPLDDSPPAQCRALAEHELDIEYMYRDNSTDTAGVGCDGGCITIGIGNKFESVEDAVALVGSFFITDANGEQRAATEQEIRDEFNNLPRQPADCSTSDEGKKKCYLYTHW